jgi:hypothetical protein
MAAFPAWSSTYRLVRYTTSINKKAALGENLYKTAVRKACIDKKLQLRICMFYEQAKCMHSLTIQIEIK